MAGDRYYEDARLWSPERYETTEEKQRFALVASMLPPSTTSLLDVGCGNGAFLRTLEAQYGDSLRLAGVEPAAAAREASVCAAPLHPAEADALPFPDGSFDAVAALEVLEHLRHGTYGRAVKELVRVARESVLVSVPYREVTDLTRCPACGCRFHPHYHVRIFTEQTMSDLFRPLRLQRLELAGFAPDYLAGNLLRSAYRRFGPGGEFPSTSVCPQCGFRGDELTRQPTVQRAKKRVGAVVKGRLPQVTRPRWMVCLYSR